MTRQQWIKYAIPDTPGVYIWRDYNKRPLYIGRATSLRDRTKSYFNSDLIASRGPRVVDMITKAKSLSYIETKTVLQSVILENNLIKKYQPYYNVLDRDDKSSYYVIVTKEEWPRVFLERVRDIESLVAKRELQYVIGKKFGPYPHANLILEVMEIVRRIFPFLDKKGHSNRHNLFYQNIGQAPYMDGKQAQQQYLKTIRNITILFEGKIEQLKTKLQREMEGCARKMKFEEANKIKKILYALDHINDIALIKKEENKLNDQLRMEAYDIAHIGGTNVVGSMVVSEGNIFAKNEYKKFKVSREKNDDIGALVEIVSRRLNHPEWNYPDIIVVDGNNNQKKAIESVLQSRRINIPVIAVTKDDRHKARIVLGNIELIRKYRESIIALNREAHRFAIAYHRLRRAKMIA